MTTITLDPQPDSPKCFSTDALRDRGVARAMRQIVELKGLFAILASRSKFAAAEIDANDQ
jgi:hypothetical protein